ncbi:hypothetical protein Tco_0191271 [Tanacetum coccineum]
MMGAKFDIEKFDGTGDFGLWRIKMRALLIQHGCEAALEVLPADMEARTKDELNKKAHRVVILCLGNKVLREVTGETTAAGVWSKLKTLYMTKSLANKLYLKKKLYTFYMPAGRKISEHIDEFNKIVLDLANIKVKFEDEDLALLLLTSLPASYEHFVDTLLYGKEALTLKDMMVTLNSKKIKERDSRQSRGKSRSKSRGGRLKYYICKSDDDLKRNCLKNNRKKSTGYVKKDDQPRSSGSNYDDSKGSVRSDEVLAKVMVACDLNAGFEEKDSVAQVWHKRLGHISEAGIQVLVWQKESSKRSAFWSLNEDILKITILKTNTPYPSRKIRRIRACTHQRPQRNKLNTPYPEDQYAILEIWNEYNILKDIKRDPYSKKSLIRRI